MEVWAKVSFILCIFGFLKEFRPSEPFISSYLTDSRWKNFTEAQVNQEIYPVGTYSYLALLVVVFLVTDLLRYKPVIVLLGLSGIITWTLLIVGMNIAAMQAVEFFYGLFMATEVAYFTYIYAQVERKHYQKVTSHTRTAFLLGRFLSGVTSQMLVSWNAMNYYQLNFLSLGAEIAATLWAFMLPPVDHSLYFNREDNNNSSQLAGLDNHASVVWPGEVGERVEVSNPSVLPFESQQIQSTTSPRMAGKYTAAHILLWQDFKQAFTNLYVVKWSAWWALATCGFLQVITYVQMLWEVIVKDNAESGSEKVQLYNGAVEAAYTLIGAGAALGFGWVKLDWRVFGEASLALFSLLQGATLLVSSTTSSLWLAYCMYVVFGVLYHTMITIANSEVAKYINEDSFGLIFGVNTFFALALQTIFTTVVVGNSGLALPTRDQYTVYGSYFLVIGAVFTLMATYTTCSHCLQRARPPVLPKASLHSL